MVQDTTAPVARRQLLHMTGAVALAAGEGVIPEGRAIARLLDFNAEERIQLRRLLMRQGWKP